MLPLPALLLLSAAALVRADCYLPNGTNRSTQKGSNDFQPCGKGGGASMCCNVASGDICRDNGLCFHAETQFIWRESCTDPTWEDPACLKLCIDGVDSRGRARGAGDMRITACPDGSLCCGDAKTAASCCAGKEGFIIHEGEVYKASEGVPTSTPTPSAIKTAADSKPTDDGDDAAGSESVQDQSDIDTKTDGPGSTNTAAIAGGVVGGVAGLGLIGLAAWMMLRRKRRGQMTPIMQMSPAMSHAPSHASPQDYYVPQQHQHEHQHQLMHGQGIEPSRTPLSELDSEMVPQPVYEMGPSK